MIKLDKVRKESQRRSDVLLSGVPSATDKGRRIETSGAKTSKVAGDV